MATSIDEDRLSDTFAALANTTRRAILARLAAGRSDGERARRALRSDAAGDLQAHQGAGAAGLIVRGPQAQYRPCALDAAPLREVSGWAEQYRPVWEARLARMDDYLQQLQSQSKGRQAG